MLADVHFIFLFSIDTQREDIVDIADCRLLISFISPFTILLSFKLTENIAQGFVFKLFL